MQDLKTNLIFQKYNQNKKPKNELLDNVSTEDIKVPIIKNNKTISLERLLRKGCSKH